jgi:manganese transport protein
MGVVAEHRHAEPDQGLRVLHVEVGDDRVEAFQRRLLQRALGDDLVPLLMIAANKQVMGELVNPRWLTALAGALSSLIIALNVFLLYQVFFG